MQHLNINWKYFEKIDNNRTWLFDIEHCPNCNAEAIKPNSQAKGLQKEIPKYLKLGMTERKMPHNEIYVDDCCDICK